MSDVQGKNSSAKWLHLDLFYAHFLPIEPKKLLLQGSTSKKSWLVQVKKTEFFGYMGKKFCFFKLEQVTKFFTHTGKKFCFFHMDQVWVFVLVDLLTSNFLSSRGRKGCKNDPNEAIQLGNLTIRRKNINFSEIQRQ